MELKSVKIGGKTARLPIIQGGMGIGISLGGLAGAVAKAGGVGIISAAQIGFREPDFDKDSRAANLRAIQKEMTKARTIAPDGVIGFNIMVAMRHYKTYVQAAIRAGADLIVSGAGLPTELPEIAKEGMAAIAPIVSTRKSAEIILKYWHRRYKRVPDLLVIEGPQAGGHLGFTETQLAEYLGNTEKMPSVREPDKGDAGKEYDKEIPEILETVREYERLYSKKIPVALAGGIENHAGVQHAFELGADAVQVATRFVTTQECDADIRYKQAYINAGKEDIVIAKSPVGMPGRAIKNAFLQCVMQGEKIPHSPCHGCLQKCEPDKIPYCITDALIHAAKGETEDALLFCGAYAYRAKRIETVKEVIDSLTGIEKEN